MDKSQEQVLDILIDNIHNKNNDEENHYLKEAYKIHQRLSRMQDSWVYKLFLKIQSGNPFSHWKK